MQIGGVEVRVWRVGCLWTGLWSGKWELGHVAVGGYCVGLGKIRKEEANHALTFSTNMQTKL